MYLDSVIDRLSPKWNRSKRVLNIVKRHFKMPGRTEAAITYYKALNPPREVVETLNTTDIKCPVLFICGEDDSGGGMVEMFKQTSKQCAGFCEIVVVREAGHFVHLERFNGFLHKIFPFLDLNPLHCDAKQVKVKFVQETSAPVLEPKKI